MNMVIVHPGTLGDVLLSLNAMRAIRRSFPTKRCVWVGKSEIGDLLYSLGEIEHAISLDSGFFTDLFLPFEQRRGATNDILKDTSHFIGWFSDPQALLSQSLHTNGLSDVIVRSPHDEELSTQHYEDRFLETLCQWNLAQDDAPSCGLEFPQDVLKEMEAPSSDTHTFSNAQKIMIHPGSGSPHKCTSVAQLVSIATQLHQNGTRRREFMIIEGPADEKNVKGLCVALEAVPHTVIHQQSLSVVSMMLPSVDLFIGHDSGLTHLAAVCGVPSIALFGPTDPMVWAPRGKHVAIIQGNACRCHDWTSVQACTYKPCLNMSTEKIINQAECWLETQSAAVRGFHHIPQ
ncbi:MAG: glycosyltransferase family 9 protein [Nitrospirales bacterium]|nr:glycosyltransferase family 9 protein [Nitrospira sp.]MDR4500112.1 glycosyltransferase family 9 protein [Nitrospirales bacterium]